MNIIFICDSCQLFNFGEFKQISFDEWYNLCLNNIICNICQHQRVDGDLQTDIHVFVFKISDGLLK